MSYAPSITTYILVNVGDKVKIYTKKKRFDKGCKSAWSAHSYSVDSIESSHEQSLYGPAAGVKSLMRHAVLKVLMDHASWRDQVLALTTIRTAVLTRAITCFFTPFISNYRLVESLT